jgi:hypothetical protein
VIYAGVNFARPVARSQICSDTLGVVRSHHIVVSQVILQYSLHWKKTLEKSEKDIAF